MPKTQFKKLLAVLILGFLLLVTAIFSNQYQNKTKTPAAEDKIILSQKPVLISLIRTTPTGEAMFAGIGPLLSTIELYDAEALIGSANSDKKGQWVLLTETPLPTGQHKFKTYSYTQQTASEDAIKTAGEILNIYIPPLQFKNYPPEKEATHESDTLYTHNGLTIDFIGYDLDDKLTIKGGTKPGTMVEAILNRKSLKASKASEQDKPGSWQLTASHSLKAGTYKILIKQFALKDRKKGTPKKGKLLSETHLVFQAPSEDSKQSRNRFVIVKAGNSLWDIAERSYGLGNDFEKIFEANQENLASPERIYPGQILYIPRDSK